MKMRYNPPHKVQQILRKNRVMKVGHMAVLLCSLAAVLMGTDDPYKVLADEGAAM